MGQHYGSQGEINALQNQFTAYLLTALKRKKRDYMNKEEKLGDRESPVDFQTAQFPDDTFSGMDSAPLAGDHALMEALGRLTARERYILFEHILNERSYDALAESLGLRYNGVASAYHRVIQKLRKELGGGRR